MKHLFRQIATGEFRVLADVIFADQDQVAEHAPIQALQFLYADFMFPDPAADPPVLDYDLVKRSIAELSERQDNDLLCIDLEHAKLVPGLYSNCADRDHWKRFADTVAEFTGVVRSVNPDLKLGWFGVPNIPARALNGFHANRVGRFLAQPESQESRYREWGLLVEHVEFILTNVMPHLDVAMPELYWDYWHKRYVQEQDGKRLEEWFYRDDPPAQSGRQSPILRAQKTALDVWLDTAAIGLRLIRGLVPSPKPLIPVISLQWWQPKTEPWQPDQWSFVHPAWTLRQLRFLRAVADSVGVWVHPRAAGIEPEQFFQGEHWQAIRRWAAKETL